MYLYALQQENGVNWHREKQRTACDKVHSATINSHPAVSPIGLTAGCFFVIGCHLFRITPQAIFLPALPAG